MGFENMKLKLSLCFQRQQPQQVPTPPRPQTQSPVTPGILPTQPMPAAIPAFMQMPQMQPPYSVISAPAAPSVMPVSHQQTTTQPQYKQPPKRG